MKTNGCADGNQKYKSVFNIIGKNTKPAKKTKIIFRYDMKKEHC